MEEVYKYIIYMQRRVIQIISCIENDVTTSTRTVSANVYNLFAFLFLVIFFFSKLLSKLCRLIFNF